MKSYFIEDKLKLTSVDYLLLHYFRDCKDDDQKYIRKIKELKLGTVIRLGNAYPDFNKKCLSRSLDSYWLKLWKTFGSLLTSKIYFENLPTHKLGLLKGAYFYALSLHVRKKSDRCFSVRELGFLLEAIKHSSIHAIQAYNVYLYQQIAQEDSVEQKKQLFTKIIENCEKTLSTYNSYAFLMMAEAYYRYAYAMYSTDKSKYKYSAEISLIKALKSCDYAIALMGKSSASIHNASLGKGLQESNTLGLSDPKQAKEFVSHGLKELEKHTWFITTEFKASTIDLTLETKVTNNLTP